MFRWLFLLLPYTFSLCNASRTYEYEPTGWGGRPAGYHTKSTIPNVHHVYIRDIASQMPISPAIKGVGLPQQILIALEEVGENSKVLRESICLIKIDAPGKVAGKEVSTDTFSLCHFT